MEKNQKDITTKHMENKQGAVDWLIKTYQQTNKIDIFDLEVANQMFKEQIEEAWKDGEFSGRNGGFLSLNEKLYYEETYNK